MSAIELRELIINQLTQINDTSFLNAIKTIIGSKAKEEVYKLSGYQKDRIRAGREQLLKGQTISHDESQKRLTNGYYQSRMVGRSQIRFVGYPAVIDQPQWEFNQS